MPIMTDLARAMLKEVIDHTGIGQAELFAKFNKTRAELIEASNIITGMHLVEWERIDNENYATITERGLSAYQDK